MCSGVKTLPNEIILGIFVYNVCVEFQVDAVYLFTEGNASVSSQELLKRKVNSSKL